MSELSPGDFLKILKGEKSESLPTVIDSSENDNLFIYWSGHGTPGALCWNETENAITGNDLSAAFSQMHDAGSYRKVLMMVEACYSGSVMEQCEGIPGRSSSRRPTATRRRKPTCSATDCGCG